MDSRNDYAAINFNTTIVMNVNRYVLTLIIGLHFLFLQIAYGDDSDVEYLDLSQAIEHALAKNFTIQVEQISPDIAAQELRGEKGVFDPTFDSRYSRTKEDNPQLIDPLNVDAPESFTLEDDFLSISFNGLLPWGTTYDLGIFSDNRRGTFNDFTDVYNTFAGLNLTQPLLRGFGRGITKARINIAKKGLEISEWEFKRVVIFIISRTIFAYNDFYFATQNLAVAERSRDLALKLKDDNIRRIEIGSMAPLDVVQAEAEVALREERVLTAERDMLDQENRLKQLLFDDIESLLEKSITITPPNKPEEIVHNIKQDYYKALEIRPDYRQAVLDLETSEIEITLGSHQALPILDLVGAYGWQGRDDSFGSSFDRLTENENQAYELGLSFNVPFPNRFGRSQKAAAYLKRNQQEITLKQFQQFILISLDNAAGRIITDWKRIEVARDARTLSEKSLAAEQKKLQAGKTSTFIVLRLQNDLAGAEIRELRAITDYNKSLARYDQQVGSTLEKFAVNIP